MTELFTEIDRSRAAVRAGVSARRAAVTLFAVVAALGLANVFDQRTTDRAAAGPGASMTLSAPESVRGGLFSQSRLEIHARADPLVLLPERRNH